MTRPLAVQLGPSPPVQSNYALGPDASPCAREPIHAPGAIQPHGALLAVLIDTQIVTHASANLSSLLGLRADAVLGRPLEQAIGEEACLALLADRHRDAPAQDRVHLLTRQDGTPPSLYMRAHRTGAFLCIDIEPMDPVSPGRLPIMQVRSVLETFRQVTRVAELCELAVRGLKTLTGFDRVMAYRFDPEGHGEVIAEARISELDPYLGLRYPASDIPAQARRLYLRQRVGAIADSSYKPVPLLAVPGVGDGSPLDLTNSTLRSASPVHCEYMRNMGTAASLTVGLAHGTALWGMLVCHHSTPRIVGPELRAAVDTVGNTVSLLLASLGDAEASAQRLERKVALEALVERLGEPLPLAEACSAAEAELLDLVGAAGALMRLGGACFCLGRTPPLSVAERALALLERQAGNTVIAVDDLGLRHPELAECTAEGSGALLLPLAADSDDAILWFRPEVSRTVTWGGNPAKGGSSEAGVLLSPRKSFAAWKETVTGRSAPWERVDLELAREVHTAFNAAVARRTTAALRESKAQLGLLAEHSAVVVALCDFDGVRHFVSPAAERVLGWRAEELSGRRAAEFAHPDDFGVLEHFLIAMQAGTEQCSVTYRHRRPDGSWLWVDGHARLRQSVDGTPPKDYVIVLRDATERKAAESNLLEALAHVERLSATDGLTGLANRRQLDTVADREWRRSARDDLPLSVLLVDADNFKGFNDRYGHLAGDGCLRAIAAQVAAAARRPSDLAARFGGEEFAVILPDTEATGAARIAEHLRGLVAGMGIVHEGNTANSVMTVSVGAATARPASDGGVAGVQGLFAAADAALYRAKARGRNRIEVSTCVNS